MDGIAETDAETASVGRLAGELAALADGLDPVRTGVSTDTVLYLVRHGRTALNAAGELRGHLDVPLDGVGEDEVTRLAALFAKMPLAIVVTSPLRRARRTAEPIAEACGTHCAIDERLVDRDYGDWTGSARMVVEQRFGTLDAAPGVEPAAAVRSRTMAAVNDITTATGGRPCMVVAHDAVNRILLSTLAPQMGSSADLPQPTGCWNRLLTHEGNWSASIIGAVPGDGRSP